MHALHARVGKNFDLAKKIQRNHQVIVEHPESLRGKWASWCAPCAYNPTTMRYELSSFREVRLDLGCGKGNFTIASAAREPDVLFLGMDAEPLCIAYAAEKAHARGLSNVLFFPGSASHITKYFAHTELARIYINFPTPYPRSKDAAKRLVYLDNLVRYRSIAQDDALIIFKSDSYPLVRFAATQFVRAGYTLLYHTDDMRADIHHKKKTPAQIDPLYTELSIASTATEYEEKLCARGAHVFLRIYQQGPLPHASERTQVAHVSLQDYLPHDLTRMTYVPSGMEGTVINLLNYSKKHPGDHLQRLLADEGGDLNT